jgi:hypothetical protein
MRRLLLLTAAALLLAAQSAQAQRAGPFPGSGNLQNYGGHWRYQHRDWTRPWGPPAPGVCWYWNSYMEHWEWQC